MPLSKLQTIVEEVNKIPINIGNSATKMIRLFAQAEEWMEKYYHLLKLCDIQCSYIPPTVDQDLDLTGSAKIDQLQEAVSEAESELSVDLEEVIRLKEIARTTQSWIDRAAVFYSKNHTSAASVKKKRPSNSDDRHTMEEMASLIVEASALQVDISEELNLLKIEQSKVQAWRLHMQQAIKEIISSFGNYSHERASLCSGELGKNSVSNTISQPAKPDQPEVVSSNTMRQNVTRQQVKSRSNSFATDDTGKSGAATPLPTEVVEQNAFPLVTTFLRGVKSMKILTPESLLADELGDSMSWLAKSFKYLSSQREAYDRKNSSALDKLIKSGQSLLKFKTSVKEIPEDPSLVDNLRDCWASIVNSDLDMLVDLKDKRSKFFDWCEKADEIISDADTKIPIETLQKLKDESASYPASEFGRRLFLISIALYFSHKTIIISI